LDARDVGLDGVLHPRLEADDLELHGEEGIPPGAGPSERRELLGERGDLHGAIAVEPAEVPLRGREIEGPVDLRLLLDADHGLAEHARDAARSVEVDAAELLERERDLAVDLLPEALERPAHVEFRVVDALGELVVAADDAVEDAPDAGSEVPV